MHTVGIKHTKNLSIKQYESKCECDKTSKVHNIRQKYYRQFKG